MGLITLTTLLLSVPSAVLASPCAEWQSLERVGALDPAFLKEASGLAASPSYPERLYHNNDSGDGPYFYLTDTAGAGTRRVAISGFVPRDVEDIAVGPCAGGPSCIFLGDIGDNDKTKIAISFVEVPEQAEYADQVDPLRVIEARYPDGPHDAEGFAIHPNGDLYLVTKEVDLRAGASAPAQIYRLSAAQLAASGGDVQTMAHVGTLDLPGLIGGVFAAHGVTAMDISSDGLRTLLLTYGDVFEWNQDLSKPIDPTKKLERGKDFSVSPLPELMQAEGITYLAGGDGVAFTTETNRQALKAPLYRQICARR